MGAVRREASGDRALETVRALSRFHRVQASPGYRDASSWMGAQLESFGITPQVEWVPGDGRTRYEGWLMPLGWECRQAAAFLWEGESRQRLCDYQEHKLSLVLRSGSARGRYPVALLEDGSEDAHYQGIDVQGRVVLTSGAAHDVHRLAVVERGAAGLLCDGRRLVPPVRERTDDPDSLPYTSFWWDERGPRGWGFVLTPRRGAELRERLRAGARLELEVEIESHFYDEQIPLLSAVIPGRASGEVLVVAHLCHPQPSANDNASGAAAALESCRVLARLRASREWNGDGRSVRFLWVPEFTGTCAWLARERSRAQDILAAVNLDMVGEDQSQTGSTFLIEHGPYFCASFAEDLLERLRQASLEWVTSYSGAGHFSMMRSAQVPFGGGSDHSALLDPRVGIPCPMLIQWPDRYYHSSYDTPDRCDPRSLELAIRMASGYAAFLAAAGEREVAWLAGVVERAARVRALHALDGDDPCRARERERLRGKSALRSLRRLGWSTEQAEAAADRFESFVEREAAPVAPLREPAAESGPSGPRVPRRRLGLALPYPRHLMPGWAELAREEQHAWRSLERDTPDAHLLCDVAWFACDGRRSLDEIVRIVRLETGREAGAFLERFFEVASRMGMCDWAGEGEPCKSDAPITALR